MNAKEKEQQLKEWNARNRHVIEMQFIARQLVAEYIERDFPKSDVLLIAELMIDLIKRFD
jgi:hypothetical protein